MSDYTTKAGDALSRCLGRLTLDGANTRESLARVWLAMENDHARVKELEERVKAHRTEAEQGKYEIEKSVHALAQGLQVLAVQLEALSRRSDLPPRQTKPEFEYRVDDVGECFHLTALRSELARDGWTLTQVRATSQRKKVDDGS